jgi:hypothetical protein
VWGQLAAMAGRISSELSQVQPYRNPTSMQRWGLCANVRRCSDPRPLGSAAVCVRYRTEQTFLSKYSLRTESSTSLLNVAPPERLFNRIQYFVPLARSRALAAFFSH